MHHLVAGFLDYKAPARYEPDEDGEDAAPGRPTWLGDRALPAPADLVHATTQEEAMAAVERMFFGEVKDVKQL